MRAEIKQNGNLVITPESEIENYALDKWWDGFMAKEKEFITVNLFVVDNSQPCKSEELTLKSQ